MMGRVRRAFVVGLGALLLASPAYGQSKKKRVDPKDEPQRLYEKAMKSMNRGYYDDAIQDFEKLRNTYPFSKYAVEAELKVADARFKKKEYADAADEYRTFAKLHPKHEQVDYATFQVGRSLFLEAPRSVDRDQSSTERALEELRAFLVKFPDSKYADEASKMVGEGRDRLAEKELYVGRYYVKNREWRAARPRLETVVEKFPDSDAVPEATFLLGKALFHLKERDAAQQQLAAYVEKWPGGEHSREARKLLARMGASAKAKPTATPETK